MAPARRRPYPAPLGPHEEPPADGLSYVKELVLRFRRRPVPAVSPLGKVAGNPEDVYRVMRALAAEAQEVFCVLHLNAQNCLQSVQEVTRGTLTASLVEPTMVFRGALLAGSSAIILVHNHPSGNPTPSQEDIRLTSKLVEAGRLIGVKVHDHVIIGDDWFVSLARRGLL